MRSFALLAVLVVVAGCARPADEGATPASPTAHVAGVEDAPTVVSLGADCGAEACFEPTIAVDAEGRIFVANGRTSPLARSDDGGATWTTLDPVPLPFGLPVPGYQRDVFVQVAPSGRLYYHALVAAGPPSPATADVVGIQVAWSEDGGGSWAGNVLLSQAEHPDAPLSGADRQWLALGEEGRAYLSFNQIPTGIWTAASDDGGATWGMWQRAIPFEDRNNFGQSGAPVVDASGRVALPACAGVGPLVYVSDDAGASYERSAEHPPGPCASFPQLVALSERQLALVWVASGDVLVSLSPDAGGTWSEPTTWGTDAFLGPWPVAETQGGFAVAFFASDGGGIALRLARGNASAPPVSDVTLAEGFTTFPSAPTDFAHATALPDGGVAVTWAKDDDLHVAFAK